MIAVTRRRGAGRIDPPSGRRPIARQKRARTYEGLELDAVDRRVVTELQAEARISNAELGRRVGLSPPAVSERVTRLERAGVITGYHAHVEPKALGYPIGAVVRIRPAAQQLRKIPEVARDTPEVVARRPLALDA